MRLRIHPDASAEIEREAQYYEGQAPGLGLAFLDEVDFYVERIFEAPMQYREVETGIRKCVLEQFPFTIRFRVSDGLVEILVVRHDARSDEFGQERY